MRDYQIECDKRVAFIRAVLKKSGASGIVYGNSGGKDSTLVGILCKKACNNTLGLVMPCDSKNNYKGDLDDAIQVASQFSISTKIIDLTPTKAQIIDTVKHQTSLNQSALLNINPRLRMLTLYAVAASENRLVAGTGNKSEAYIGYFTKWGDGAFDFNVIGDLTVTEIYEFLRFLHAPEAILNKAPSAGLYEGQTDEQEIGLSYRDIDEFLLCGKGSNEIQAKINEFHFRSDHKRQTPLVYGGDCDL